MSIRGNKTRNPGYQRNNHWVECMRCGFTVRSSDTRKEWTGLIVCKDEWEPRHPQDMIRAKTDNERAVGLVHSESPLVEQDIAYISTKEQSSSAVVNLACVGLAKVNTDIGALPLPVSGL